MSWNEEDLNILCGFAAGHNFIMETGGGLSTVRLAEVARQHGSVMVSIEIDKRKAPNIPGVEHKIGWSVTYKDMIKKGSKKFIDVRKPKSYPHMDRKVAVGGKKYMKGKKDLIRKSIVQYGPPDFFFCDTGEFSAQAEWNIIKYSIPIGGIFICHDIYYPKSIKSFRIVEEIKASPEMWDILAHTESKQGLMVARKNENIKERTI